MFDGEKLVAQFFHLLLCNGKQLVEAGAHIDFTGFRSGARNGRDLSQLLFQPRDGGGGRSPHPFKKLWSQTVVLAEQGEQQMFSVNLLVSGLGAQGLCGLKRFTHLLSHLVKINHIDLRHPESMRNASIVSC